MKCASPGCRNTVIVQWAQLLGDDAVDAHLRQLHQNLLENAEEQRRSIRFRIAALQDAHDSPPKSLSPEDVQAFLKRAETQITATQAEHDAVPVTFDLEHHRAGAHRNLGHCEEHMHADASDWYARIHQPSCDGTTECGCA